MNPKMLAAFKDGTKTMVELAAMANATGLVPDVPGAHGARVDVAGPQQGVCAGSGRRHPQPARLRGVLGGQGGARRLCHHHHADAHIRADLKFYTMGDGPYYTLYRPFHLCSIETPQAVAEAVIYGEAVLKPQRMVAELVSVAKRDLKAGQQMDGIGGYDFFSRIYTSEEARSLNGMPMGLTPGGRVIKDIGRGELLTTDNFAPDTTQLVYKLRQLQESLVMKAVVVRAPMEFGVEEVAEPVSGSPRRRVIARRQSVRAVRVGSAHAAQRPPQGDAALHYRPRDLRRRR
jgi:predicted homoserine dehydrogenase-like protein